MKEFSKYVGLDVHQETIAVSVAEAHGGEVRYFGEIANTAEVRFMPRVFHIHRHRVTYC
jgi:hypothetical protein